MPGPDGAGPAAPSVKGLHKSNHGDIYQANGFERTRTNMLAAFGYFHTESSHHGSEYVPYFRKNARMIRQFVPYRWDYFEVCSAHDEEEATREAVAQLKQWLVPSVEYGSLIIDSIETGQPRVVYGNVENRGAIPNLPGGLLRRGAVPGRSAWRAADDRGPAAATARGRQPERRERAEAGRRGGAHRRARARLPRGDARSADRRRAHARPDSGDGGRAAGGRGGLAAGAAIGFPNPLSPFPRRGKGGRSCGIVRLVRRRGNEALLGQA